MDGTFEPIHKCIDRVAELNLKIIEYSPYGGNYNYSFCGLTEYWCGVEDSNPFECLNSFLCATISTCLRCWIGCPLYWACCGLAFCGYCATNKCCNYKPLKARYEDWEKRNKTTVAKKVTNDLLGKDVGSIVADYMGPPSQSID